MTADEYAVYAALGNIRHWEAGQGMCLLLTRTNGKWKRFLMSLR